MAKKHTLKMFKKLASMIAPPPKLTVSQWADENRVLSKESSAEHGKWNTDRAPYQREIMDSINDPNYEEIVVMSSAQVGKSEIINNIIGYHIDYDPAPMLLMQPTLEMAEAYSKDRIAAMIRDTPSLSKKVNSPKAKDGNNTLLQKKFAGGHLTLVGANSPASLASRPVRIVLADEVDRFPSSAVTEGDPLSLAHKRTKTFWNRKKISVSKPTIKGASRIEAEYEESTKEQWSVSCPSCGMFQPFIFVLIGKLTKNPAYIFLAVFAVRQFQKGNEKVTKNLKLSE
ncbi:phage terminase large subunit family protein [Lysinibacillus sp. KU-BSD001]|uniref:phage terminase large subunit family protein n=1 Tax=Lysinibacillus sp. KU-BSD001 TaxID=3141328 RepID=UPI0036E2B970